MLKKIFKEQTSLLLVETVFLASEKQFFPFVKYFWLLKVSQSSGNVFFNEFFIPASGNGFLI